MEFVEFVQRSLFVKDQELDPEWPVKSDPDLKNEHFGYESSTLYFFKRTYAGLRIRIYFMRIRIQGFENECGSGSRA